jgi:hypothetical protein
MDDLSARTDGGEKRLGEQAPAGASSAWQQVVSAIRDEDKTPLVRLLLEVIEQQARRIAALEAEVARLKEPKKPASNSKPSALSKPAAAVSPDGKRPGSEKRSKTKDLPIHKEIPVPPKDLPPGATLWRRDPYVVQDLVVQTHNTRYMLETWRTPTGDLIRGELPTGIRGHFGPGLLAFMLQQHYAAHVPQSRLLEELRDYGNQRS